MTRILSESRCVHGETATYSLAVHAHNTRVFCEHAPGTPSKTYAPAGTAPRVESQRTEFKRNAN